MKLGECVAPVTRGGGAHQIVKNQVKTSLSTPLNVFGVGTKLIKVYETLKSEL